MAELIENNSKGIAKIIRRFFSNIRGPFNLKTKFPIAFCLLGYLFLTFLLYPGLFLDFSNKVPFGDHGDAQNILGIINYSIHSDLSQLYNLPVLYPLSYVLARTHPSFGISAAFKIFRTFGLNLESSVNLYIILALLVGALGCYLLTREFSKNRFLAFVFAALYIIYFRRGTYFHWLNFLSDFYFPFVLYFTIRYFKTQKVKYIFLFTLFAVFQFLSSVYYGVHVWIFLIPALLIFALILRIISLKNFWNALVGLSIGFAVIVIIFSPFLITQQGLGDTANPKLLTALDLFSHNALLNVFFDQPDLTGVQFFPGYTILLFVLFYLASLSGSGKKRAILFVVLSVLLFFMTYMTYVNLSVLQYTFFIFLSGVLVLIVISWKRLDKWERIVLLTFSFYTMLLLKFHINFESWISLYDVVDSLLPFMGLKGIRRVYPIILPLLIVLAALGGNLLLKLFKKATKIKVVSVGIVVLCFMILENFPYRHPLFHRQMMKDLPAEETDIYDKLPFKENEIVLEIPYYFQNKVENSRYLLNWELHQNYLLNGKVSIKPHNYYRDLMSIIGPTQKMFPKEMALENLIQKYSVTYIIFHWDLLEDYQNDSKTREKIGRKIRSIRRYGKVIYEDDKKTLLKVQEFIPVKRIVRTYAMYHLRKNELVLRLKNKYSGQISIYLNDRLAEKRKLSDTAVMCDFKNEELNISGNKVEIVFQRPVVLKDIHFSRLKKE